MHLTRILGVKVRVFLTDGPDFRAEDMQRKIGKILSDFLPDTESSAEVIRRGKRLIELFGDEKDVMTTISPGWYRNFMNFGLSRNRVVNVFKGPVAIVP